MTSRAIGHEESFSIFASQFRNINVLHFLQCLLILHLLIWMILQTETIDLAEESSRSDRSSKTFRRSTVDQSSHSLIDVDGLPYVGQVDLCFLLHLP